MSADRVSEIEAREQEATPGPWTDYEDDCDMHVGGVPDGPHIALFGRASWPGTQADSKFVAHARADVPYLLAELKTARAQYLLEGFRAAIRVMRQEGLPMSAGLLEAELELRAMDEPHRFVEQDTADPDRDPYGCLLCTQASGAAIHNKSGA